MDRHLHKKYIPQCGRNIGLVDQYSWPEKDTNTYPCINGISAPIYDCKGWINFSLPLHLYPKVDEIHPEIAMSRNYHLNSRPTPSSSTKEHFDGLSPRGIGNASRDDVCVCKKNCGGCGRCSGCNDGLCSGRGIICDRDFIGTGYARCGICDNDGCNGYECGYSGVKVASQRLHPCCLPDPYRARPSYCSTCGL